MKRSKFTEAQIAFVLKQAEDGTSVAEVLSQGRNCTSDFLQPAQEVRWRYAFRELPLGAPLVRATMATLLKMLDEENARLKRRVADLSLDKAVFQDVIKGKLVDIVLEPKAPRSTYNYRAHGNEQAELKKRIPEIAETRERYGCRRIHVLLRREGWHVNAKRFYRLYHEMAFNCGSRRQNGA